LHRIFRPPLNLDSNNLTIIDKKEIHHIRNVLRSKVGEDVIVFNGKGTQVLGKIKTLQKNSLEIDVLEYMKQAKNKIQLILACAIPKHSKFEWIIEKSVELGVDVIVPMITSRTEFKYSSAHIQKSVRRFDTIAINAAKQSNRSTIPLIQPIMKFEQVLEDVTKKDCIFIPHLDETKENLFEHFRSKKINGDRIIFFIGPEGDFTSKEINMAKKKGGIPVSLGKTVLKVDTAALCVLSIANLFLSTNEQ